MSDRELVGVITANTDEEAAFCLFHHKLIKLFEYLSGAYSKLRYSAGDIASEMYIYLNKDNWSKLRSFEFRSTLFGWIKVVTNRYLLNKIETTSPCIKDVIFFSCLIEQGEEGEYDPALNIPDPNQILLEERRDDSEFIQELYKEIDLLSDYLREVIRLRGLAGLSAKETAELLCKQGRNVTPGAVDQVFKRAKDTIREKIINGGRV
jgi:RNA polymerase sigma factor (sigma-70 family)